ncbi:hypothetical protein A9Q84_16285 [Halobacteriovorax marinus]|uniref:DNA-binding transcriptional regulator n=1 Tax=Halobacteriovorax marinus TaxID=97084 RepID=A0A1Y5FAR2_9BACT|nr:hypothetical protein A9Q84_16285 [Halobacteriovorax marinus]
MRKAERLFQLVTLLRGRRQILTAEVIAKSLHVSVRTVYRDIQALSLSGVPIEGEAGVGYRLSSSFNIPPVMFNQEEITALSLALKMVKGHSDEVLSRGAASAEDKILSIIPDNVREVIDKLPYYVPNFSNYREETKWHTLLREACLMHQKVLVTYKDQNDVQTNRTLWPLGLMFWGQSWTLLSWCELREDYRNFRLDRFNSLEKLEEQFPQSEDISVSHYLSSQDCEKY